MSRPSSGGYILARARYYERLEGAPLYDTLASYQEAIVDVLCSKAVDAAEYYGARSLILCGGVACNGALRERFESKTPNNLKVFLAPRKYCTDNAAMIAGVAYRYYQAGEFSDLSMDAYARFSGNLRIPMA